MKTLACIGLILLFRVCASGADGQTLINQATVTAAGGFPYTISQSGSYKLSGNLVNPVFTNGIVIAASNVTLDLNGFTISCTGAPANFETIVYGITAQSSGLSGITIRNGSIRGFWSPIGAAVIDLNYWTLEDLSLLADGHSLLTLTLGIFCRVTNVTAPVIDLAVACPTVVTASVLRDVRSQNGLLVQSTGACMFANNALAAP